MDAELDDLVTANALADDGYGDRRTIAKRLACLTPAQTDKRSRYYRRPYAIRWLEIVEEAKRHDLSLEDLVASRRSFLRALHPLYLRPFVPSFHQALTGLFHGEGKLAKTDALRLADLALLAWMVATEEAIGDEMEFDVGELVHLEDVAAGKPLEEIVARHWPD